MRSVCVNGRRSGAYCYILFFLLSLFVCYPWWIFVSRVFCVRHCVCSFSHIFFFLSFLFGYFLCKTKTVFCLFFERIERENEDTVPHTDKCLTVATDKEKRKRNRLLNRTTIHWHKEWKRMWEEEETNNYTNKRDERKPKKKEKKTKKKWTRLCRGVVELIIFKRWLSLVWFVLVFLRIYFLNSAASPRHGASLPNNV